MPIITVGKTSSEKKAPDLGHHLLTWLDVIDDIQFNEIS